MKPRKIIFAISVILLISVLLGCYYIFFGFTKVQKVDRYLSKGEKYRKVENFEKAIIAYENVLKLDKENMEAYLYLSNSYLAISDMEKSKNVLLDSIEVYDSMSNLNTNVSLETVEKLYLNLADIYDKQHNIKSKIEILNKGIRKINSSKMKEVLTAYYPKDIIASIDSGTYEEETPPIIKLIGEEGSVIYYTLDGTKPREDSYIYQNGITLEYGENTITAVSFNQYGLHSNIVTFQYTINKMEKELPSYTNVDVTETMSIDQNDPNNYDSVSNNISINENDSVQENEYFDEMDSIDEMGSENVTSQDELTGEGQTHETQVDEIKWMDQGFETAVRKEMNREEGPISKEETDGYTGALHLEQYDVKSLKDLIWFPNITEIYAKGYVYTDAEILNSIPNLKRVVAVYSDAREVEVMENISVLQKLKHFGLSMQNFNLGQISPIQMLRYAGIINQLENLEYLDLSYNGLTDISLFSMLEHMNKIKILFLNNNKIEDISILKNFTDLEYVDLSNNLIKDWSHVSHVKTVIK